MQLGLRISLIALSKAEGMYFVFVGSCNSTAANSPSLPPSLIPPSKVPELHSFIFYHLFSIFISRLIHFFILIVLNVIYAIPTFTCMSLDHTYFFLYQFQKALLGEKSSLEETDPFLGQVTFACILS